jgi:hypothetical protein
MTEPVLALILIVSFTAIIAITRYVKTLEGDFWDAARIPVIAGVASGLVIRLLDASTPRLHAIAIGIILTIAALFVRLTGEESESSDGMLLGALTGASASLALIINGDAELRAFSECTLAGAVAGFGITLAVFHVANKFRQIILDVVTAIAAIATAFIPSLLGRLGVAETNVAFATGALIPVLVMAAAFQQWPDIRAELRHEASLGFLDDEDVRPTANPLLRLGRGGWTDAQAHREFVRVANRIALRKRQQRHRPDEVARIYQLEIIKLRMQLQEMTRIDRLARSRRATLSRNGDEVHSDTIAHD